MASRKIVLPESRLSFPHIFKPQTQEGSDKKVYGASFIFNVSKFSKEDKAIWADLNALLLEVAKEKFNKSNLNGLKSPIRDDESFDLDKYPEYKGMVVVSARSYDRPISCIGPDKQPLIDPNDLYAGCYVRGAITVFGYNHKTGGKGLSLGLSSMMKVKDGEPFVARSSPDEDFADVPAVPVGATDNEGLLDDDI